MKEGRPEDRNLADSAALAAKVEAKKIAKQKAAEDAERAERATPVVRKKKEKKKEGNLDDLLSAGLEASKKKKGKK